MTHTLVTEQVSITDLRPHPANPRNGDVETIMDSLRVNDQYRPIVTARDGTILAGNHTYAAAMELGWQTLAVVRLDLDPGSKEARRIMLADNRTSDLGRYDDALLLELLDNLDTLDGTGYDPHDLDVLRAYLDGVEAAPLDADEFDGITDTLGATLTIPNLSTADIGRFRALPGDDDRDRFLSLLP